MKYMLMMSAPKADFDWYAKWSKQDLQANINFMRAFSKELKDAGVFVSTEGLAFPQHAKIVRAGSRGEPVTDGVFPESKEFLAGYGIVEVENEAQALQIAARASSAPGPGGIPGQIPIEVRQVLSGPPEEMPL
ncbi:YciI family protein [Bryobacter aggregatus]|uniref:YciI family protein n=1 Tax=Bryobacter aggregatus TaxID=360054 RepID=UPI0004E1A890|nr:YciI family protein [Bryobacter aggregatus]